jgi:hypothetical protein
MRVQGSDGLSSNENLKAGDQADRLRGGKCRCDNSVIDDRRFWSV